ncbi:MAG: MFS transporter [Chloroflexi bacterium]|nr:MFS transporter [Chloroflexota bacterium]
MSSGTRPKWWGSRWHRGFTLAVLVVVSSMDNTALAVVPPLYGPIGRGLGVHEATLGALTAASLLVVAATAVGWGFLADRGRRKGLLIAGTAIWAGGALASGLSASFAQFAASQVISAVGLGAVASLGFSLISDFVPPRKRGAAMAMWGIAQGLGAGLGLLTAGFIGAEAWSRPFIIVGGLGLLALGAFLFSYEPQRGASEPALRRLFRTGRKYAHVIRIPDLVALARRPANGWMILQGATAQIAFGSMVWVPFLLSSKVEAAGTSTAIATAVGSLLAALFQIGGALSVVGGRLGDAWQRRNPRGRALIGLVSFAGAVPLYVAFYLLPMGGLAIPDGAGAGSIVTRVLWAVLTNWQMLAAFLLATCAVALSASSWPNYAAMLNDANLPEHRSTIFGIGNFATGLGRASGALVAGTIFVALRAWVPPPMDLAIGLAILQGFLLIAGFCFWGASRHVAGDIAEVRATLRQRAAVNS